MHLGQIIPIPVPPPTPPPVPEPSPPPPKTPQGGDATSVISAIGKTLIELIRILKGQPPESRYAAEAQAGGVLIQAAKEQEQFMKILLIIIIAVFAFLMFFGGRHDRAR